MGLFLYYLVTLIIISVVSYFLFLVTKKLSFIKLLPSFFVYLLGSFIISGIFVYSYFFSEGEYVNRGIAGAYITVLFVLIGNGIAYVLTHFFRVKRYAAFSGMFYISLPFIGLFYIIAFIVIATTFNL
ncbi:hypothetical protein M3204_16040 [Mesobacillus subterraneus]|uniref:hypothetical protein n=1 Tax=Mesobacillus subterraneus TaxID=285983 RepID=UPI00203E15A5|nr:hypothetical protein [Mesobacillus subterraneus]MCM3665927.1 hypothetical protein [Mesobacillus subterraneus]MCM3684682.1 hypothetical protein [Mesobacillus subterraneus]